MTLSVSGEKAIEDMVSNISSPVTSALIGPPGRSCLLLSLRVRSGLITFQWMPSSMRLEQHIRAHQQLFRIAGREHHGMMIPAIAILDLGPRKAELVLRPRAHVGDQPRPRFSRHSML